MRGGLARSLPMISPARWQKRAVSTPTPASRAIWLLVIFIFPPFTRYQKDTLRIFLQCQGG